MDFARIDLNLLVVFDTVMRERNVTRAASMIGLTQSATSSALGRLRQLFQDELFVRSAQGMTPTPRAEELAPEINDILLRLRALDSDEKRFDPAQLNMRIIIGMSDYVSLLFGPKLLAQLEQKAPGIKLVIAPISAQTLFTKMDTGQLDMAIDFCPELPGWAQHHPLFLDEFICMMSDTGSHANRPFDLETYVKARHCQVSVGHSQPSAIDTKLEGMGYRRDIVASVPNFLLAPFIVAQSDYVSTLPSKLARYFAATLPIKLEPLPLDLAPFGPELIWHRKTENDPAHKWLRNEVRAIAKQI